MMPEPRDMSALQAHIEQLKADYAAMARYLDSVAPHWRNAADADETVTPADDAPDYLWNDQPVLFARSLQSDGVPMAWVTLATGESVMAPLIELKPMKDES